MLGFLFNDRECKELDYVLRKELDEMLFDLNDQRVDTGAKSAIELLNQAKITQEPVVSLT